MTKFGTEGHEVEEKVFVSKFLEPGIHVCKIQKVEYQASSQKGTPGMVIVLEGKPMEDLEGKGQTAETNWWLSEKAWPYTKDRVTILADKLGVRANLDAIKSDSAEEYANALNGIFAGKAGRFKLAGAEIAGKFDEDKGVQKKNWFKGEIAGYGFVEPLSIKASESKLTFDKSDPYDMKMLPAADTEAAAAPAATSAAATSAAAPAGDEAPWD